MNLTSILAPPVKNFTLLRLNISVMLRPTLQRGIGHRVRARAGLTAARCASSSSSPPTKYHSGSDAESSSRPSPRVGEPMDRAALDSFFSKWTWSVSELLATPSSSNASPSRSEKQQQEEEEVTPAKLHHLLRLSALPLPASASEEASMMATLREQLHFVRKVQEVDTSGVQPLVAIRNETEQARRNSEITLDKLQIYLDKEEQVGRYKRIVKKKEPGKYQDDRSAERTVAETGNAEGRQVQQDHPDWDPLERAPERVGRYIKINIEQR